MLRTLCLSGGGFRATLYHLGVISALRDFNLLTRVKDIYSVSGGSILAAHLVLNWEKYNSDKFRQIAGELISFIRSDIRGRLIRRWVIAGCIGGYRRVNQLIKAYDELYEGKLLEHLEEKGRPNISILATNLISGDLCAFTKHGIRVAMSPDPKQSKIIEAPHLPLSIAVAASSAFPPLFPPVKLDDSILRIIGKEMPTGGFLLSDGGVIDNLGIATLAKESYAQLFVSDASAGFEIKTKQRYGFIFNRTIRSTDILMSRIAELEQEKLDKDVLKAHISNIVKVGDLPTELVQSQAMQAMVKFVRTDLDRFSDVEIDTIYQHGYEVAAATILPALEKATKREDLPKQEKHSLVLSKSIWRQRTVRWIPSAQREVSDDVLNRVRWLGIRIASGLSADAGAQKSDPDKLEEMKLAGKRKWRVWDSQDPFCWIVAVLVCSLVFFILRAVTAF